MNAAIVSMVHAVDRKPNPIRIANTPGKRAARDLISAQNLVAEMRSNPRPEHFEELTKLHTQIMQNLIDVRVGEGTR